MITVQRRAARPQVVFPVAGYQSESSQSLLDSLNGGDSELAHRCLSDPFVDVNFVGTVSLKSKKTEIVLHDEDAHQVRVEYEEFKTGVTALFLAAHVGNLRIVRQLLVLGANVNQKVFRGFAVTAAVREAHSEILELLINAGACQEACEEALMEASNLGLAPLAERLMASEMIRRQAVVRALVSACCRGFVEVVEALIKGGVNVNGTDRILLRSSRPSLYTNVDCTPLTAAVVCRQISIVGILLKAGAKTDFKVKLGAWSWDTDTGEEFRVGVGLADPYSILWCAVEYYESSGTILRTLLRHFLPNTTIHLGRTLIHHAVLCNNAKALQVLLNCGADKEFPIKTSPRTDLRAIHLAARLGHAKVLQCLTDGGCNLDSRVASGDSAPMICARYKHGECIKVLASEGADFGLVNSAGQSAGSIAQLNKWTPGFQRSLAEIILSGKLPRSTDSSIFSPLMFVTKVNDIEALKKLIERADIDLDGQDEDGHTAIMIAAAAGHEEAFGYLLYAGANIKLCNKKGENALSLAQQHQNNEALDRVLLKYVLEEGKGEAAPASKGFYALHRAARIGDLNLVHVLTNKGCDVNSFDVDGYTPLMLAAKGGHADVCELLISKGAKCDIENARQETALLLARKHRYGSDAEEVILDELARSLVLDGTKVKKHTKCGKGSPHSKVLRMVGSTGVLRWGKSSKRNVVCKGAEVGPSAKFRWNRRRKFDVEEPGIFHVVTTKNKEIHFVCEGGAKMAQLWVRGIKLVTREAIFGSNALQKG